MLFGAEVVSENCSSCLFSLLSLLPPSFHLLCSLMACSTSWPFSLAAPGSEVYLSEGAGWSGMVVWVPLGWQAVRVQTLSLGLAVVAPGANPGRPHVGRYGGIQADGWSGLSLLTGTQAS